MAQIVLKNYSKRDLLDGTLLKPKEGEVIKLPSVKLALNLCSEEQPNG